ncbi:hypothetical protein KDW_26080 [Dictyobacter vulcani]|uniref:Uncharacterized protein n=1 Tax=Dictyobacter vulcani TaxID=2607529 RepID=A0A5J4KT88_9CHLR|nr:hypothetical protein [Dictyobacter vulcani]GER88446.1 hypothetical protein KDW_26080 [Dictyobacter vulcani]
MFIDTLMVLWNRICVYKFTRTIVTCLLVALGILVILGVIGLPAFSRSADIAPHRPLVPMVESNNNDAIVVEPLPKSKVTPPVLASPAPTPLPTPTPTGVATPQEQNNQNIQVPVAVTPSPSPVATPASVSHPALKIQKHAVQPRHVHITSTPSKAAVKASVTSTVPPVTPLPTPVVVTPTPAPVPAPTGTPSPVTEPSPATSNAVPVNLDPVPTNNDIPLQ